LLGFVFQDLCDRLFDICDNRKELAEKERQSVISEGWLEDRLGLLTNFYITLMQAEVDRYQDTVRLLRDYYVGMEGELLHLLTELQVMFLFRIKNSVSDHSKGTLFQPEALILPWTETKENKTCVKSTSCTYT